MAIGCFHGYFYDLRYYLPWGFPALGLCLSYLGSHGKAQSGLVQWWTRDWLRSCNKSGESPAPCIARHRGNQKEKGEGTSLCLEMAEGSSMAEEIPLGILWGKVCTPLKLGLQGNCNNSKYSEITRDQSISPAPRRQRDSKPGTPTSSEGVGRTN